MEPSMLRRLAAISISVLTLVHASAAQAAVRPPVVIKMPRDTPQATSGREYAGIFEVHIAQAGVLADFKLEGEGWVVLSFETPPDPGPADAGVLQIPFRAVPRDADRPIRLTFTWDGRRVSKAYELGPKYFGRVGKMGRLRHLEGEKTELIGRSVPTDTDEGQVARGGAIPLQFSGRFVYRRSDGKIVGADHIWVEVMDDDGAAGDALVDESIWSWHTDENGYFDSPVIWWDDCDEVGCDEPDIYVRFECDMPVGQVQDPGVMEEDYYWWTMDNIHEDFTGSSINFGTMTPDDPSEMSAVHIWNTLVRGHRYIGNVTGIDVDHVDIQWPETGISTSGYIGFFDEIYIIAEDSWSEGTVMHEYGHHFLANHSVDADLDYCNGYCDGEEPCTSGTDCEEPGHCSWCPENESIAWNEGFPNWLGYLIPTSFSADYQFDDCTPYEALDAYGFESVDTCCQDSQWHNPWLTEGFVTALLRDMTDQKDDAHDEEDDDHQGWSPTTDCMNLDPATIFTVVTEDLPTEPDEFISRFLTRYPQYTPGLWKTAQNVHPDYIGGFAPDTEPPGPVTILDSPTHPIGVGGALPCITVEFEQPADDVTGSKGFSADFITDPGGIVPIEDVNWPGPCVSRITSIHPKHLGSVYYLSIRAVDYEDHWGPATTFGPFIVNADCNNNGITDLCDIACDATAHAADAGLSCYIPTLFCDVTGCGTSDDCNFNLIPDDCDLANGTSKDCDRNGIPDECYVPWAMLIQWADGDGSWHNPNNWYKRTECPDPPPPPTCGSPFPAHCPALPELGDNVCINSADDDITVTYTNGATQVGVLGCYESLSIAGGASGSPYLVLDAPDDSPSWVSGDLSLSGSDSTLSVWDRFDIGGLFTWTARGELTGPGVTYANGGVQTSDIVYLDEHHLVLDNNSTSVGTGRIEFVGASVFEIRPGSSYEHQGGTYFLNGGADDQFLNQGTLIKSVNPGTSMINAVTSNTGLIHVQAGTLSFRQQYSSSGGDLLGDPGTAFQFVNGGFTFHAGSSVVADNVLFTDGSAGWNTVRGTWNVTTSTTISAGQDVTFAEEADIVNYGSSFSIPRGTANFNAPIGGPVQFDTFSIGPSSVHDATANFNSGDPVETTNLTIGRGQLQGPSPVTIDGLLTWNAGGGFCGPGTINANGDVLVNVNGDEKSLRDCTFNNAGTATFLGGFNRPTPAVVNNLATGVIDIQADGGAIGGYGQPLNNAGRLVKSAGTGTSTIQAAANNTGTVEVQAGVLRFYTGYGGHYIQTAGRTILNGGSLKVDPASAQISSGLLTGLGTITGNVVNSGGTVEPGLSVGRLDVAGTYTQGAGGSLSMDIGGALEGEYDILAATGAVSLAGSLDVELTDGFGPDHGDRFRIVRGSSVTGQFNPVSVTNLSPELQMVVYYSPTTVTLIIAPVDGDCNEDYIVGLGDLTGFELCMAGPDHGLGQDCECADLSGDGDVDLEDAGLFQVDFTGPLP